MLTAEDLAKEYVDTIYGPTNAWGQCVHPTLGRSDYIMRRIFDMVGREQGKRLINLEMHKRRVAYMAQKESDYDTSNPY